MVCLMGNAALVLRSTQNQQSVLCVIASVQMCGTAICLNSKNKQECVDSLKGPFFCEVPSPALRTFPPEKAGFIPKTLQMACDFELILH